MVSFGLACLVVGLRLLFLARWTHKLPELLLGLALISGGCLGYFTNFVVDFLEPPQGVIFPLRVLSRLWVGGASVAVLFVVWRVFRPDRAWAGVLVGMVLAMFIPYLLQDFWFGTLTPRELLRQPLFWSWTVARIACFAWMSGESFYAQRQLRRRLRMGLKADRVLAARLLFWSLGTGAIAAMFAALAANQLLERSAQLSFVSHQVIAVLGLTCSLCLWLAFFPPPALLSRVAGEEGRSEAA